MIKFVSIIILIASLILGYFLGVKFLLFSLLSIAFWGFLNLVKVNSFDSFYKFFLKSIFNALLITILIVSKVSLLTSMFLESKQELASTSLTIMIICYLYLVYGNLYLKEKLK